ncbi:cilia- and flagella-associated protein 337-like [Rhynchocyon petersi]
MDPDKCLILYGDDQLSYYDSINAVISSSNHEPTAVVIALFCALNTYTASSGTSYTDTPQPHPLTLPFAWQMKELQVQGWCAAGTTSVKQKVKGKREGSGNVPAGRDRACPTVPQRRADGDQTVFRIHRGVRAFTFCKKSNLLLTGGMDRIIRIWNPYLPGKPTGLLKGHAAPVLYTHVTAEDSRIFSTSADSTVKIWDLETHSCLFTACSKASGIHGEPTACLYLPRPRALCVVTDTVALLHLRPRYEVVLSLHEPHRVLSHREPVVCCCYNPAFRHVASCSEASVIRVWDLGSGRLSSEFVGTHGDAGVTCLTFDTSGRRLVTGGRDGCLKIWSYNNGHCLHTLSHDENSSEVCDCTYLEVNQSRFIIAVGWDRRINVYFDIPHDFHHFWKPQPHWLDDLNHGHKEDILCVAQCPPALLATSSYDGEIIVWNVTSGHIYCKLNTPVPSGDPVDPERGVSCLAFLKTRAAKFESASASLMANGPQGSITFWKLFGGACVIADFTPSRRKAQVSSIVVTADDALAYLADQEGFVHVYDIKEYGLQGPEPRPPRGGPILEAEIKEEVNQWLQRTQGPAPQRSTEPVWPSIHQTLRCQEIAHVPAFGERPDLSVIGSDRFSASTPPGKKVSLEPPSGTTDHRAGSSLSELQGNQATLLLARPASLWTPKA